MTITITSTHTPVVLHVSFVWSYPPIRHCSLPAFSSHHPLMLSAPWMTSIHSLLCPVPPISHTHPPFRVFAFSFTPNRHWLSHVFSLCYSLAVLNTVNNFRSFTTVSITASSPFRMFVFFIHPNIIDYQLRPIWAVWDDVHVKKGSCGDKIDEGWYNAGIHYATRITYFLLGYDDR